MGAWSEDIFGSDDALDVLSDIEEILGVEDLDPEDMDRTMISGQKGCKR